VSVWMRDRVRERDVWLPAPLREAEGKGGRSVVRIGAITDSIIWGDGKHHCLARCYDTTRWKRYG